MHRQMVLICFLIAFAIQQIQTKQNICSRLPSSCDCFPNPYGYDSISCDPRGQYNSRIRLEVNSDRSQIQLECKVFTKISDYEIIPRLLNESLGEVLEELIVDYCSINDQSTFIDILHKLGANSVKTLAYRLSPGMNDTKSLKGDYFRDLNNLDRLQITDDGKTVLEPDLLKHMPNLTILLLSRTNLKMATNFFESNSRIKFIDISETNLEQLPDNVFDHLANLEALQLWNMNLSTLNQNGFDSLINLNTLDLHSNNLQTLPADIFQNLKNLENLNLNHNPLTFLPGSLLRNNKHLIKIRMSDNSKNISLTNGLFSNLPNLEELELLRGNIAEISEDLFWNSKNIKNISMQQNKLKSIPAKLFRDTIEMTKLWLNKNLITSIPDKLFENLTKLEYLDLSDNQISKLDRQSFMYQTNLLNLNLANNKLETLHMHTFSRTGRLESLILRHNQLVFGNEDTTFSSLQKLKVLDLANNSITNICYNWHMLTSLRTLDLEYNKIQFIKFVDINFTPRGMSINISHNLIQIVDMAKSEYKIYRTSYNDAISAKKSNRVDVSNNPIQCSCGIHDLVRYFNNKMEPEVYGMVELVATDLKCAGPTELRNQSVKQLDLANLYCNIDSKDCPNPCSCKARKMDNATIIDCSNRNLTVLPKTLPHFTLFPNIILFVNNNNLSNFETANRSGYQNIKELYIQNNHLSDIKWFPHQIQVIELHSNNFKEIDIRLLENLTDLRYLTLHNNPWKCNCDNVDFMSYIQSEHDILQNKSNILCDSFSFMNVTKNDLCTNSNKEALIGVIMFFIVITITITVMVISFYQNKEAIKVWLFKHEFCLCWVSEQDLDKDKKYDAFVCYSHQDEDFITKELIPNLEQCEKPFKLCIHNRDWLAGEMIPDQIARTLIESRRTLVVLSPHFFTSTWAKMEFRSAHKNAMDESRARVIVIKYGDIGQEEDMDPEVQAYLKLHTYIEWGDKRFWDKLRYALPHPPPLNSRAALISQRIKRTLGDTKFLGEALHNVTTVQPTSKQTTVHIPQQIISPETNDKNSLLLNNLQKQIANENHTNRNIA